MKETAKVLVALSGGVDSSVAAWRLREQGMDVETAYIRTWLNESELGDCPAQEDIDAAQGAAVHLGLPFRIINLVAEYRDRVVSYLVDGYRNGITPNPDILCNREMKFGVFKNIATREGYGAIATGHYCRIRMAADGSLRIFEGVDPNKDQSYFLSLTRADSLRDVYFPIGDLQKSEVRELAAKIGLPNAAKKDSQGICFLGKVKIDEFLAEYIPDRPGPIVNVAGNVVGEHKGLHRFTIGQRKGIGVPSNTDFEAYVVVAKDFEQNRLIVGFDRPETPHLYHTRVRLGALNWFAEPPHAGEELTAKPRYRDPQQNIRIESTEGETCRVSFAEPQRAVATGQILALYRGEELIGGGIYEDVES